MTSGKGWPRSWANGRRNSPGGDRRSGAGRHRYPHPHPTLAPTEAGHGRSLPSRQRATLGAASGVDGRSQGLARSDGRRGDLAGGPHQLSQPRYHGFHRRHQRVRREVRRRRPRAPDPLRRRAPALHPGSGRPGGASARAGHSLPQDPSAPSGLSGQRLHAGSRRAGPDLPALRGARAPGHDPHRDQRLSRRAQQVRQPHGAGRRRDRFSRSHHPHGPWRQTAVDERGVLRATPSQERARGAVRHAPQAAAGVFPPPGRNGRSGGVGHRLAQPGHQEHAGQPGAVSRPAPGGPDQGVDHARHTAQALSRRAVKRLVLVAGPLALLGTLVVGPPGDLAPPAWRVAGLALWMALWWLTAVIPLEATALLPIVILPLLGVGTLAEVTGAYADPVIFLFLGGFFIAATLERWELHRRFALSTVRLVGTDAPRVVLAFLLATAAVSMWISNTATAVMMLPIAAAVAGRSAGDASSGFQRALLLSVAYGASIGGVGTLIGTPPNAIFAANARQLLGVEVGFGSWMLVGVPAAILMLAGCWLVLVRLFRVRGPVPGVA